MTNIKKYSALSIITLACMASLSANAQTPSSNSQSSDLVMYRGMIMTQDEYDRQKNFEGSLTYDSEQNNRVDNANYRNEQVMGDMTPTYTATVVPTSEKMQRNIPLTRQEVTDEYIRAKKSGELDRMNEEIYGRN